MKLNTDTIKDFAVKHQGYVAIGASVVLLSIVWLAYAWFGASSAINVPKGVQYETNSNAEKQTATVDETQANDIRTQRIAAHTDTIHSKSTLNERKNDYAKILKAANDRGISNANLDVRQHKLLTDLDQLYPAGNSNK